MTHYLNLLSYIVLVQVYHSCLKKYFSNSTKSLDKYFMKNNHHLDFLQGLFSAPGIETAFFTHNLNLLSYIELVGGVFAPLLFVFYINLL